MAPPKFAPLLMPTRNEIAATGDNTKVSGMAMAMAIGPLRPGIAPTTMPTKTPNAIRARLVTVSALARPERTTSMGSYS